jgi:hypothetical protein
VFAFRLVAAALGVAYDDSIDTRVWGYDVMSLSLLVKSLVTEKVTSGVRRRKAGVDAVWSAAKLVRPPGELTKPSGNSRLWGLNDPELRQRGEKKAD